MSYISGLLSIEYAANFSIKFGLIAYVRVDLIALAIIPVTDSGGDRGDARPSSPLR